MKYVACFYLFLSAIAFTSSAHVRLRRQWRDRGLPWHVRPFQVAADEDFGFIFPEENRADMFGNGNNYDNNPDPNNFANLWRPQITGNPERPNTIPSSTARTTTTTTTTTTTDREISTTARTIHFTPEGCNCPYTPQFNPVCGTDGNTYKNSGLLNCYRRCGINVIQRRMGSC